MAKLTKASFAAAKRRLGIKKVTKKNIGRIAKAARGGTGKRRSARRASPKPRKRTSHKSHGGTHLTKHRHTTIPLAIVGGFVGAPAVRAGISKLFRSDFKGAMGEASRIAGIANGRFDGRVLLENVLPMAVGVLVHKFVGGRLGLNRALGRSKIPLLRL